MRKSEWLDVGGADGLPPAKVHIQISVEGELAHLVPLAHAAGFVVPELFVVWIDDADRDDLVTFKVSGWSDPRPSILPPIEVWPRLAVAELDDDPIAREKIVAFEDWSAVDGVNPRELLRWALAAAAVRSRVRTPVFGRHMKVVLDALPRGERRLRLPPIQRRAIAYLYERAKVEPIWDHEREEYRPMLRVEQRDWIFERLCEVFPDAWIHDESAHDSTANRLRRHLASLDRFQAEFDRLVNGDASAAHLTPR